MSALCANSSGLVMFGEEFRPGPEWGNRWGTGRGKHSSRLTEPDRIRRKRIKIVALHRRRAVVNLQKKYVTGVSI